jgi:ArsR family transcriptional regulator
MRRTYFATLSGFFTNGKMIASSPFSGRGGSRDIANSLSGTVTGRPVFCWTMENKEYTVKQEQLARFAKALGHPARVAIMEFLIKQNSCFFGDIHEVLPISKATVSQHLKELKDAGLIQGEIETPKVKYCINRENWKIASTLFAGFFGQCVCKKESCCE